LSGEPRRSWEHSIPGGGGTPLTKMTDTTCPSCDAPAPARARSCAQCGYRFVEDGGRAPRPQHTGRSPIALAIAAILAAACAAILVVAIGGGGGRDVASGAAPEKHLAVLSRHPLSRHAAEHALEARFITIGHDHNAAARCSGRIPKPAHSVRRCRIRYPGGHKRAIVLLTTANGAEVISEP
jgi:hypothetical protein